MAQEQDLSVNYDNFLSNIDAYKERAEKLENSGGHYEKGLHNNGIPNPGKAIQQYIDAKGMYDLVLASLDEFIKCHGTSIQYEQRLSAVKERTQMCIDRLNNKHERNKLYIRGLAWQNKISTEGRLWEYFVEAKTAYKKAIFLGHVGAKSNFAHLLCYREIDLKDGIAWYRSAIEDGDASAMNELGVLYQIGKVNGKQDCEKAIEYYDRAIALNCIDAMLNRARLHISGKGNKGIPQYDKAIELLEKVADLGDNRGHKEMNRLAEILCNKAGEMYALDKMEEAIQLYKYAYKLGAVKALNGLGDSYKKLSDSCKDSSEKGGLYNQSTRCYQLAIKEDHIEPEADQENIEPEADQENIEPETDQENIEPEADQENIEPETDQENIEPEADQENIEPETDQENIEPETDQENIEPEADKENAEPEIDIQSESRKRKREDADPGLKTDASKRQKLFIEGPLSSMFASFSALSDKGNSSLPFFPTGSMPIGSQQSPSRPRPSILRKPGPKKPNGSSSAGNQDSLFTANQQMGKSF